MPSRRPGRKRKQGERTKGGRLIAVAKTVFTEAYMDGIVDGVVITPEGSQKPIEVAARLTILEVMGIKGGLLEAGKELERLWHLCRKYKTSAPPITAKASSLQRGFGHDGEERPGVADFGAEVHKKYQGGIVAMAQAKYVNGLNPKAYAHAVIRSVLSACVENKPLTIDGEILCKQGLKVLADHWNY